jgi:uncharacterized membrane protein
MSLLYRALMFVGSWVCHQLPERSPHLFGVQVPVCWRCTGILVGALMLLTLLVARRKLPPFAIGAVLGLLLPIDVFHAVLTGGDGNNARRLVTGLLWGVFATSTALHLAKQLHMRVAIRGLANADEAAH